MEVKKKLNEGWDDKGLNLYEFSNFLVELNIVNASKLN